MARNNISVLIEAYNNEIYKLLVGMEGKTPDLVETAHKLVAHYDRIEIDPYAVSKKKLAVLIFLGGADFEQAVTTLRGKLGIIQERAEKLLLETINQAPEEWLKDDKTFEEKGLIRGLSKYYVMHEAIGPKSDFQKFRAQVNPEYRDILRGAIDTVYTNKTGFSVRIQPRVLSYVAAQLIHDEKNKAAVFAERAVTDSSGRGYVLAVAKSVVAIEKIARGLDIDISALRLVQAPEQKNRVRLSDTANQAAQSGKQENEESTLASELKMLNSRGVLTATEQSAYLLIQRKRQEGRNPAPMEIISWLSTRTSSVAFADAAKFEKRVETYLEDLRKDLRGNPFKLNQR